MKKNQTMSKLLQLKLLSSVLEFLARVGVPEAAIRDSFERGLIRSRTFRRNRVSSRVDGRYQRSGDVSAQLLRLWHRDSRFIDGKDFNPRPLLLSKGKVSLRALVSKLDPVANPMEVLNEMKAVGLIRRLANGRYVPTASAAVIPQLHPWAVEHATKSVVRLVSTVCRNAAKRSSQPPLLERYSYVPDLNPAEALAFAEFSRSQGQTYLDTLDDWL
jgi:hypothetical protein